MRILNNIIDAYSSVWYGIIAAVIIVAALFFLVAAIQGGNNRFLPLSYILGIALTAFLSFQLTFLIGAIMFKSDCNEISSIINDFIPNSEVRNSAGDIRNNLRQLAKEEPFVKNFIDIDDIDESLPDGAFGDAVLSKVHSFLNWYIVRRILWCLVFVIVGAVCVVKSMSNSYARHRTQRLQSIQRDRKRVSRRPRR